VLRDRLHGDREGLGELVDRRLTVGEALEDRTPRRVGEGGEGLIEVIDRDCVTVRLTNSLVEYSSLTTSPDAKERPMGRIVVTEFVSVDGVMEDPGGSEDFKHGGWSFEFSRGEEGDKFKLDEALEADALLLGRKTYEGFAAAWPERSGEFADKFNNMPKYVVSSTLSDPEWTNTTVLEGDLAKAVSELRDRHDGDVVVHGSAKLVEGLLEQDLVDELRLMVFPVVLGTGKRIFGATSDKKPLELAESKTVGDGVEILVYRPKR
jgi:dihydrofolate reductase